MLQFFGARETVPNLVVFDLLLFITDIQQFKGDGPSKGYNDNSYNIYRNTRDVF